ncbi:MAG: hypothetical protein HOW73_39965 [Polyangiaceae bacterium]|nr:hypothetical protein [Polyangiaceae bacterium]
MGIFGDFFDRDREYERLFARQTAGAWVFAIAGMIGLAIWWVSSADDRGAHGDPVFRNYTVVARAALESVRRAAIAQCTNDPETSRHVQDVDAAVAALKLASNELAPSTHPVHKKIRGKMDAQVPALRAEYDKYQSTCDATLKSKLDASIEDLEGEIDVARNPSGLVAEGW